MSKEEWDAYERKLKRANRILDTLEAVTLRLEAAAENARIAVEATHGCLKNGNGATT